MAHAVVTVAHKSGGRYEVVSDGKTYPPFTRSQLAQQCLGDEELTRIVMELLEPMPDGSYTPLTQALERHGDSG